MWPFRGMFWLTVELLMQSSHTPLLIRLASPARRERAGVSDAQLALALLAPGIVAAGAWHFARRIRREGWSRFLHSIFTVAWQREDDEIRGRALASAHKKHFDTIVNRLYSMPTEIFQTEDKLLLLSHDELLAKLQARQITPPAAAGKKDLVGLLRESSTETCCVICLQAFEQSDVLRRLHCGHLFHLACVDKWLLHSAGYSRPVSCAMCNVPLCKETCETRE